MAATVVQHGRRKGMPKSPGEEKPSRGAPVKPSQVAVLSPQDWRRIQATLLGEDKEKEDAQRRHQQRVARHECSKNSVKNWGNTIEGQRQKKLQARQEREEEEEEERLKIDQEEAEYQAKQRKEAIDRAKTLLYYQTDRVKGFHSALLLSEVLRERDQQIAFKERREALLQEKDKEYLRFQELERENGILSDLKLAKQLAKAKDDVAKFQLMQAEEHEKERNLKREAQLKQQAAIEEDVQKFFEEEREKEAQQQQRKVTLRSELDQVVADKKKKEEFQRKQEQAEEEEIRIFADAKKRMMKMRKAKEIEIFQEFQKHQERMTGMLADQMKQKSSDEDRQIAKAVAEQEAKREREEREKDQKFLQTMKEIHVHRRRMVADVERKEKEQADLDREMLKQRIVQDQKFHAQQMDKEHKAAKEAKEVQQFHRSQMAQQAEKRQQTKDEETEHFVSNMALLHVEEKQFQEYASGVIKEAHDRGAPIYPLKVAAKTGAGGGRGPVFSGKGGVRPSYQVTDGYRVELPSYSNNQLLPPSLRRKNTMKRMGFTW